MMEMKTFSYKYDAPGVAAAGSPQDDDVVDNIQEPEPPQQQQEYNDSSPLDFDYDYTRRHRYRQLQLQQEQGLRRRRMWIGIGVVVLVLAIFGVSSWIRKSRNPYDSHVNNDDIAYDDDSIGDANNNDDAGTTNDNEDPNDDIHDDMVRKKDAPKPPRFRNATGTPDLDETCETTLLLMRHCEKDAVDIPDENGNYHCNYMGRQRAMYVATLFAASAADRSTTTTSKASQSSAAASARWPAPSFLYALTADRDDHLNFRQWETLYPLSQKVNVSIQYKTKDNLAGAYRGLLTENANDNQNAMCDKVTVVSWKHSYMVETARALGCDQDAGCPDEYDEYDFDSIWQLAYVYKSQLESNWVMAEEEALEEWKNGIVGGGNVRQRQLGKSVNLPDGWAVYGTVVQLNFDPLSFRYHEMNGSP